MIDTRSAARGAALNGIERVDVTAKVVGNRLRFVADAAIAGLGIALLPVLAGERAVADRHLVGVLPRFATMQPAHVLAPSPRVALVRDRVTDARVHEALARCAASGRARRRRA